MTTYQQRIATLSGEDEPETKTRYEVTIGGSIYLVDAYDTYQAERYARGRYRTENRMSVTAKTPETVARWIGKSAQAVTK